MVNKPDECNASPFHAKWLFFDVGSTLVDEQAAYDHRIRDMIAGTGLTFAEVAEKRLAFARQGFDGNSKIISYYNFTKTPWHSEDEVLYDDAVSVLETLSSRGYQLGIIANQIFGAADRLADRGIAQYFGVIAASAELGVAKPDPEIFKQALAMAGCDASQAAMIGDRLDNDVIPAKRLGMQTVWFKNGSAALFPDGSGEAYADAIIRSLSELTNIFT